MRKALIIMIVLLGLFLAIGCMGNKPVTPNEKKTTKQAVTPAGEEATERQTATEMQNVTEIPQLKEYTLKELAEYNGKNGKTYVAYQGKVYDVSNSDLWKGGIHKGHTAGKNLTEELNKSPHGPEIIKGFPVVGTLKKLQLPEITKGFPVVGGTPKFVRPAANKTKQAQKIPF
jgi:predicted heme/steroid binding protein